MDSFSALGHFRWLRTCKEWLRSESATIKVPPTVIQDTVRAADLLEADLEAAQQQRNDLLARIHGDGGDYRAKHGLDKAIEDAHRVVADLWAENRELKARMEKAESECDDWRDAHRRRMMEI